MKLAEQNCTTFTQLLSSAAPAPGGGGAAALCGALAVSLCAMAGTLSAGRKASVGHEEELSRLVRCCAALRCRLLSLIDEDAVGFLPLAKAYSLPKDSPGRAETLREATLHACRAPMEMLRAGAETAALLEQMEALSSPLLLSDVGCGASLCRSALECAALNLAVNTKTCKSDPAAKALDQEAAGILDRWLPRMAALAGRVREKME